MAARPGAEELHRVVSALDATNGVEHRFALLLQVVEGVAHEHGDGEDIGFTHDPSNAIDGGFYGTRMNVFQDARYAGSSGPGLQQTHQKTSAPRLTASPLRQR